MSEQVFPEPNFPQNWEQVKRELEPVSYPLRELLIYLVKMEMENTLCRAEAGHDTLREVRQELSDYRVLQNLLRTLKREA